MTEITKQTATAREPALVQVCNGLGYGLLLIAFFGAAIAAVKGERPMGIITAMGILLSAAPLSVLLLTAGKILSIVNRRCR